MTNKYVLNREKFDELLEKAGYKNYIDFCKRTGLHRNTLNYYLSERDVFSKKFYEMSAALGVDPLLLITSSKSYTENIEEIKSVLEALTTMPKLAVVLLGSRAKGSYKKYSDWDLGVTRGSLPVTGREFLRMRGRVSDLADNLPRKVDLVNLDAAPEWFLLSIDYELIFLVGSFESYQYLKGVLHGIKQCKAGKIA